MEAELGSRPTQSSRIFFPVRSFFGVALNILLAGNLGRSSQLGKSSRLTLASNQKTTPPHPPLVPGCSGAHYRYTLCASGNFGAINIAAPCLRGSADASRLHLVGFGKAIDGLAG